ncbi:MAG: hypothetical protein IT159_02195 [Bryobacterales bacterium]|nr:hypothetical protein [Bryobacterales bacterium]
MRLNALEGRRRLTHWAAALLACFAWLPAGAAWRQQSPPSGPSIEGVSAPAEVAAFQKFEVAFQVTNTVARNFQFPYDASPPPGIDPSYERYQGISVDAAFSMDGWRTVHRQPAFFAWSYVDGGLRPSWDGRRRTWLYPANEGKWIVRFTPHVPGRWEFRLSARDASGATETKPFSFQVVPAQDRGFIRVSRADRRYFEFDDGSPFWSTGLQATGSIGEEAAETDTQFAELSRNRILLVRAWLSGTYGSAWLRWVGGRNIYGGYLPRSGLLPFHDPVTGRDVMTLRLEYPQDWFDACRYEFSSEPEPVKPDATYAFTITYTGQNITGPRNPSSPEYGLVGKISESGAENCQETGSGKVVTTYGKSTPGWNTIRGFWYSGANNFAPKISFGLENVNEGSAFVRNISLREVQPDGSMGPEILREPSMEYETYIPDRKLQAMDRYLELAEKHGIYLKVVLMEKNDHIYQKIDDDGSFVIGGEKDNLDGFYGLGRGLNKTRWLQQAWWRTAVARWGYSKNIHSWELVNEGDPFLVRHWEMADEFGKFMHCRAFGVDVAPGDGAACRYQHPNSHPVTTSFWHSFPAYSAKTGSGFWGSPKYPNVDYADVHAYISTSPAPEQEKRRMEGDAAYYHLWHAGEYGAWKLSMPVMRGEAGMVPAGGSTDNYQGLGLERDINGTWYHNYLWASLDSNTLYEIYWYAIPHVYLPGRYDHRTASRSLDNFMSGIPLNNGNYRPLDARVSGSGLRVAGQKDPVNGRAHIWIQNTQHTWRNVVDRVPIPPASATVRIPGFPPDREYAIEWWDTYKTADQIRETTAVRASSEGVVALPVEQLVSDVAVKVRPLERASESGALPTAQE